MKYLVLSITAMLLGLSGLAQSGNEGSIQGTIIDPSGAVVPQAVVRVRNLATSTVIATTSDQRGFFKFFVLPVGAYEIIVEHPHFATLIQTNVSVAVGAKVSLSLPLMVAPGSESVTVSGQTPLVETTRAHVSGTFDERQIKNLPVNGRNFIDFALLAPGVVRGPEGRPEDGPSFGGQRSYNLMLVDGAENQNAFLGGMFANRPYQFSMAAVREFQVNINGYSAELGHAGNGTINTVTKSGGNSLHGELFWYFRDQALNANDVIRKIEGKPREPLHIHQFGASLGGPLLKNRLFFFANYDGQRRRQQNATFLDLPSGFQLSTNAAISGFQQSALDYLTPRAAPWIFTSDLDVAFTKLEWNINAGQLLTGRWNRQRFTGENLDFAGGPQTSLENTGPSLTENDSVAVSLTSTLSHRAVNVARFNYLRHHEPGTPNSPNPFATIFEGGQLVLAIGRTVASPRHQLVHQTEYSDTLSLSRGLHALKMGVNLLVDRITWAHAPNFSGSYRFNSLESFGRSLAGTPVPIAGERFIQAFSGQGEPGAAVHPHSTEYAAFFQDEWRIRPNLTFNMGLRYDLQVMASPKVKNPSPLLAVAGIDTSFVPFDPNNFSPRAGFAWSPRGNQRLVVRGGYGLFYLWTRGAMAARSHYQNGVTVQTRTFSAGTPSGALIPAYPNTICGVPDPSGVPPSCPPPNAGADILMPFSSGYVQGYDQHVNLGFEMEVRSDWALAVSYVGVKGVHLQRWRDVNLATPESAAIGIAGSNTVLTFRRFTAPRPVLGFDRILQLESNANSDYHSLVASLRKSFSANFQFSAGYTFGKVIDDRPEALVFNPGGAAESLLLSDPSDPRADRAVGLMDARHRFVTSGIWELNYTNRLPRLLRVFLAGWETSGIFAAQSGRPYSGNVNFDLNNDGNPFSDRTPGLPRNTLFTPSTYIWDARLTRNVMLNERVGLQFIWEAFNVLNHANISAVRTTQYSRSTSAAVCGIARAPCLAPQDTGSTAFGGPAEALPPRIMQLVLKLHF